MEATDNERMRKEAAHAVVSTPPAPANSRADQAMQRYLGGEIYHALEHGTASKRTNKDKSAGGEDEAP